jgi:hypothetical protein
MKMRLAELQANDMCALRLPQCSGHIPYAMAYPGTRDAKNKKKFSKKFKAEAAALVVSGG